GGSLHRSPRARRRRREEAPPRQEQEVAPLTPVAALAPRGDTRGSHEASSDRMSPYRTPPVPPPAPDPAKAGQLRTLAGRWCLAVPSFRAPALRVAYMRSELERGEPERVANALDELCGRAEQADALAREVLSAVTPLLVDSTYAERLRAIAMQRALLP